MFEEEKDKKEGKISKSLNSRAFNLPGEEQNERG